MTDPKKELSSGRYSSEKAGPTQMQKTRRENSINDLDFIVTKTLKFCDCHRVVWSVCMAWTSLSLQAHLAC